MAAIWQCNTNSNSAESSFLANYKMHLSDTCAIYHGGSFTVLHPWLDAQFGRICECMQELGKCEYISVITNNNKYLVTLHTEAAFLSTDS